MWLIVVESVTRIAVNIALLRFLYSAIQCMEKDAARMDEKSCCLNSNIASKTYAKIGKKMMSDTL